MVVSRCSCASTRCGTPGPGRLVLMKATDVFGDCGGRTARATTTLVPLVPFSGKKYGTPRKALFRPGIKRSAGVVCVFIQDQFKKIRYRPKTPPFQAISALEHWVVPFVPPNTHFSTYTRTHARTRIEPKKIRYTRYMVVLGVDSPDLATKKPVPFPGTKTVQAFVRTGRNGRFPMSGLVFGLYRFSLRNGTGRANRGYQRPRVSHAAHDALPCALAASADVL